MAHLILLDRGHGGGDPGAVSGKWREAELNTALTRELEILLTADENYWSLTTTPYEYTGKISVPQRAAAANALGGELLLSQHFNAGGGRGFEVYPEVPRAAGHPRYFIHQASLKLARLLAEEMEGLVRLRGDGGVRYRWYGPDSYYGILRQTAMPSVLVENAFVDSPDDMALLGEPRALRRAAQRQYRAICRYFGTRPLEENMC